MKRFLTPQEKKVLRYEKDRRNTVAESRSICRKAIAKRKALANRSLRHAQDATTAKAAALPGDAVTVPGRRGKRTWRKIPDATLADFVGRTLQFRSMNHGTAAPALSALWRIASRRQVRRPKSFKGPLQHAPGAKEPVGES